MATQSNTTYALVKNVAGLTPASPVMVNLDYQPGNELSLSGKTITSPVNNAATRSLQDARIVDLAGGGSLSFAARRDAAVEELILAAIGADSFTANVAKAGKADTSFTIEKKMLLDQNTYHLYPEIYVTKFAASYPASDFASYTFEFMGRGRIDSLTPANGATYTVPTRGSIISGDTMNTMSLGGITSKVLDLQFETALTREAVFGLGSSSALQINASNSPRMTKVTAKILRSSIAIDNLRNTKVPVNFTTGVGAGNQLIYNLPNALVTLPADSNESGALVVTVEFWGLEDSTLGSELSITRA